jgi:uncharacterized protein YecE (DUF72 family)
MNWYLGTMGFSYKEWQAVFYPAALKQRDYLAHYSQVFNSLEVDSSFYGTPKAETVERWAQVTPADFRFCPKTPREITHDRRLDETAVTPMNLFLDTMRRLDDKLGPILIQLPPDYDAGNHDQLGAFLAQLPADLRYAVEFRHASWHATATGELLQQHNVSWVSADYIYLPQRVYVTTDFIYIRWLGRHGQFGRKDHEQVDRSQRLQQWRQNIEARQAEFNTVYGFFNDDFAGHAPASCNRFKAIAGLPTVPHQAPQQGVLELE